MSLCIAFVMDPIESINPRKDSTLAMLYAAEQRGWQVLYLQQHELFINDKGVAATVRHLTNINFEDNDYVTVGEANTRQLASVDIIVMRKDPPFDMAYVYATYLLEKAEKEGVLVANRAESLRNCNEKLFATDFPQCCSPLVVGASSALLKTFLEQHQDIILKPLDGMGGASIFRVKADDPNIGVIIETLTDHGITPIMAQKYIPEITLGDKRILMINGEPVDYVLARIPKSGETRGNLAAGGTGVAQPISPRERWIAEQIGPELRKRGIFFAGLDVIGDYLTEINVTSPTCIREIDKAYNTDIAGHFMDALADHRRSLPI